MRSLSAEQDYIKCPGAAIYPQEREWLKHMAKDIAIRFYPHSITIVNIGIMWGATMWALRTGAKDARLIGVDINIDRDANHTVYKKADLRAEFIETDSTHYDKFRDPIHLLFIDGCHHEHTVAGDIKMWSSNVIVGGVMAFHDYNPNSYDFSMHPDLIGVRNAVDKWYATSHGWEHVDSALSIIAFKRVNKGIAIPLFNQVKLPCLNPVPA